jgi:ATP-binding cassette subfamily B protein
VRFGKAYDARLLRRLWTFCVPHRVLFLASLLSYPVVSALHLAQPYLIKVAIDEHFVPRRWDGFHAIVTLFVLAVVAEFSARFVQTYLTQLLGQRVTQDLRAALFHQLQIVDLAYIERNPLGRLITRVTNDVESIAEMFATGAVTILGDFVTLAGIVASLLLLDARLTIYSFSVLPLLVLVVVSFRRPAREAFRDVRTRMAQLNGFLNEAISGMTLVQVFRQEGAFEREFAEVNGLFRDANFRAIAFDAITYATVEGLGAVAVAAMIFLGAGLFQEHTVSIGVFIAFIDYLRRFFAPITELSTKYTVMQAAMASAERCFDLLDQAPSVLAPALPRPLPAPPPPFTRTGELRFENVVFGYQPGTPVLRGLELNVSRGEKVAIVGPTGAGKSTLVKLIARFYDPTSGRLTLDGADLKTLDPDQLRSRLAIVLQDAYLFDGSIRDNVRLGRPEVDQSELDLAAARTRAKDVIGRLEGGWDTPVGERGGRLSSGERQLVAFARVMVLDPDILILDEATSAVDPETEGLIQDGLSAVLEDRTAIIIAHRLSTIRRVDRIVVLSAGRVVEHGSHDELLKRGGVYKNLYELQFANPLSP